ncbi:hypothetical protein Z517_02347 [Fonsecaea pedrosoi CBS 271.37]|uniref:Nucleolar protein Dnt1-like N-terminal domain-containing protein n=1 Tax=Fonsecaea pedrosoi CBS 271.37 TaxID=1442368 RepID=A0A0D2GQ50_9EURO|nr:uncharacterized protein Z517_02347 [Fonsecaea pedrosoi CBS 271.37]KIW83103.1 hypothetical protein Z517_02347 [Fonsecaea pedrosoi CBS 271.37]
MVKLRVAARIFSEDNYLQSLQGSATSPVKGEKRLVVVVRDPYKWQIGTLALEVQRAYRSCYQVELPTIKYLKDNEDDCDLDPRAYVADLLLDEGRAQIDASDQRVTIKVILEQGLALREGSVAIGSQLDDPRYQDQLEKSSRPPVPTFPAQPSSLGKRSFPVGDEYDLTASANKRPRQVEIPETQRQDQIPVSSIEHEDVPGTIELVEGTQFTNPEQDAEGRQNLVQLKQESPELRRVLQNVTPATLDELEELTERPPTFGTNKRPRVGSTYPNNSRASHQPNGLLPSTNSLGRLQKRSQGPITPPSETSRRLSNSVTHQSRPSEEAAKSTAQSGLASTSASKFKRRDIYDYPESEIDDSQMSPRSRQAQLSNRKSMNNLSHIAHLQSPREPEETDFGFTISQAIEALETESVFDDSHPLIESLPAPDLNFDKTNSGSADEIENSIYEDAEMGDVDRSGLIDISTPKGTEVNGVTEAEHLDGEDKENEASLAISAISHKDAAKATHAEDVTLGTQDNAKEGKPIGSSKDDQAHESRPSAKRVRKRKSDTFSTDTSQQGSTQRLNHSGQADADKGAKKASNAVKKPKESQKTSTLDSPGEQLSQDLRESAENQLHMEAVNKRLAAQQRSALATPAKKNKVQKPGNNAEGAGSVLSRATGANKDVVSTTTPARAKNKKLSEKPAAATTTPEMAASRSSPTVVLHASQSSRDTADLSKTPLPNWGSEPAAANKRGSSVTDKVGGVKDDKEADSKTSSFGLGLTPEEIRILESRKGMTKEQYEADKKRRQLEAKKTAEGQRKQGAATKKKSTTDKSPVDKSAGPQRSKTPEPKPAVTLANTRTSKSLSFQEDSPGPADKVTRPDSAKDSEKEKASTPGKAASVRRESSNTSFSKSQSTEPKVPLKTPAKASTKSPSVQSFTISKTPKPSAGAQSSEKAKSSVTGRSTTPAPAAKSESKIGKTPAKTPQTKKPTLGTAKRLVDLHEVVRGASKASKAAAESVLSRVNAAKQKQKPMTFTLGDDDDDDDDDDESDDESEEEETKNVKVVVPPRKTGQDEGKSKSQSQNNNNKKQNISSSSSSTSDDDSSTTSTSSPSSEEAGKKRITNPKPSQAKGNVSGRAGRASSRNRTAASDDDDSQSHSEEDSADNDSES